MKSLSIRLEGTEEQVQEGLRRLAHVVYLDRVKWWDSETPNYDDPSNKLKYAYLRAYFYEPNKPEVLLNQLEAAHWDIHCLEEALGEAELEIERLKKKLGEIPEPRPYDVVLGGYTPSVPNGTKKYQKPMPPPLNRFKEDADDTEF